MSQATSISAVVNDFFYDVAFHPTVEVFSSLINYVGQNVTVNVSNHSATDPVSVKMTLNEIWLYFVFKFSWLLLLIAFTSVTITYVLYRLYYIFFVPLNRIRRLGSLGYIKGGESGAMTKKEIANMIQRRRKIGANLPPVYPNGWFRLLDSNQLSNGEVKEVCALGEHSAVYRSQSGKVTIMDAYCPHMGANLAVGGRVRGECLECPFHGWVFDSDGKCIEIPYAEKIPSIAKTKSWPCREINETIYVWYHCDGVPPEYEIPKIEEISSGRYRYGGRSEYHINTHIQDIPENGADVAHLYFLHRPHVLAGSEIPKALESWTNFFVKTVLWTKSGGFTKEQPHLLKRDVSTQTLYLNKWKTKTYHIYVEEIGPGIAHLYCDSPLGKTIMVHNLTPSEPLHQVFVHKVYSAWKFTPCLAKLFLLGESIQTDRDILIWNNKAFEPRPLLAKEDKDISQFRRWFSQFYSENSPRLSMKENNDLQW